MEQFDDEVLQEFIKDKEVLSAREHFFVKHETPYLAVFLTYLPGERDIASAKKQKESWKELISDDQLPLFNTLRDWRAERAKQDGVSVYIICNNRQLAEIVVNHPTSLSGFANIHGFGKAKTEKYGKEILTILQSKEERQKEEQNKQEILFDANTVSQPQKNTEKKKKKRDEQTPT